MTKEQQQLLEKAKESLKASKILLDNQLSDFATARAYYTMFYIASAFLEQDNLSFSKHSGIISAFGQYLAKSERVPKIYHRYIIEAEKLRNTADYNLDINITKEEATQIIINAEEMLNFAINNLSIEPENLNNKNIK